MSTVHESVIPSGDFQQQPDQGERPSLTSEEREQHLRRAYGEVRSIWGDKWFSPGIVEEGDKFVRGFRLEGADVPEDIKGLQFYVPDDGSELLVRQRNWQIEYPSTKPGVHMSREGLFYESPFTPKEQSTAPYEQLIRSRPGELEPGPVDDGTLARLNQLLPECVTVEQDEKWGPAPDLNNP
jgi:hypothetical protein